MSGTHGRVAGLWRYPVKSMLGEECDSLDVNDRGVQGDRLFAVHDANGKFGSGKTTRRFQKIDGLLAFRATYYHDDLRIVFPDGAIAGNDSKIHAALSKTLRQPVTLAREDVISHLDAAPLHLLTTASLAWLKTLIPAVHVDERRFRPNILIGVDGDTQVERLWLGKTICIGDEARLRIRDLTERCVMVDLPQADLPNDSRILRDIARNSGSHFGVYADVLVAGRIKRHDATIIVG